MAFARRWNPQPKAKLCPQCNKNPAILTRPDLLCANCARPVDDRAAQLAAREAAKKK